MADSPFIIDVTKENFQQVMETVSGQDLAYFFQQWVFDTNYPEPTVAFDQQDDGQDHGQV